MGTDLGTRVRHVPGVNNDTADDLFQLQVEKFHGLTKDTDKDQRRNAARRRCQTSQDVGPKEMPFTILIASVKSCSPDHGFVEQLSLYFYVGRYKAQPSVPHL
ncbi:hypothetical protein NDU88_006244 [Pleurodeles waltl]|uniref:Uncharacterized protein n=1 Tax=Pleurodeles waltl TaxID=8319 RepID=A0AAV7TX23_PLEWA|nr:hypothetical protein NDU88_006244 [Pleurodeles waltl]